MDGEMDMETITEAIMHGDSIEIPEGTVEIPDGAFRDRKDIRNITFPDGLKAVGKDAFRGCSNLRIPELPASLETIGEGAFFGCMATEKFQVNENNKSFWTSKGALYRRDWSLVAYPAGCRERRFIVSEYTEFIEDYAFCGCGSLESIEIGSKVSRVTGRAFAGCRKLQNIRVSPRNEKYCSMDGDLYSDYGKELVFLTPMPRRQVEKLDGVERMGTSCLAECYMIDALVLQDTLEDIAPDAFGDRCRPKRLFVERHFDLDLPFEFCRDDDEEGLMPGFIYRRMKDGRYEALEPLPPREHPFDEFEEPSRLSYEVGMEDDEMQFRPITVNGEGFDRIAGLEEAKELMYRNLILPAKHPELFDRFELETCSGVLLYGPPGTGKTMLARAVASEVDAKFYNIKSTDIRDCYVGESEKNLRRLFATTRRDERAVIFFDDFDSLGRMRGHDGEPWQSDLINELLVEMQGVERHKGNIMVLAATNRPWDIDSALKRSGRFTAHIYVGLPNREARETIIRKRIGSIPHAVDLDLGYVASKTEGYNGADVEEVCRTAKMHRVCMMDSGSTTDRITSEDFEYALSKVYSSVSKKDMKDMETYRRTGTLTEEEYVPKDDKPEGYC